MNVNTSDFKYFKTLARVKNITQAAREIGITQPSLSLAIQRLEKEIGAQLFIRSKKGAQLTKAGEEVLKGVSKILEDIDRVFESAKDMEKKIKGCYRFGVHPSLGLYTLKNFVPDLLEENPGLELEFFHGLSSEVAHKVINLELDLGLVVNPVKQPDLVLIKLFDDEVAIFGHPKTKDPEILFCDKSLLQSRSLLKKIKQGQFKRIIHTPNLENIASLLMQKRGAGILPTRVAQNFSKNLKPLGKSPIFKDEIYLAFRVENKNIQAIQMIAEHIKAKLRA